MQIKASCGSNWGHNFSTLSDYELELQITGDGTLDNPYVITSRNFWHNEYFQLNISRSNSYIKIKGLSLKALYLKQCENITILDANIKYLGLKNCSIISIENVKITKKLSLVDVSKIKLAECKIGKLLAFSGEQISIFNSDIKKISRKSKALFYIQAIDEKTLFNRSFKTLRKEITPDFWLCSHCGSEVDMFSRFCHECGIRIK